MKRNKKLFTAFITAALTAAAFTAVHAAETKIEFTINDPYMHINGMSAEIDPGKGTAPVIVDGRTLLPIRATVEAMGGEVEWNADTKTTVLKKDGDTIELTIGSSTAYLNGESSTLDTAPVILNDRTMLPLRFIAEGFGFKTDWDADTKSITVTAGEPSEEIPYNNATGNYVERRATDGRLYSIGFDGIYILDKDKKALNKYEDTGDMGIIYTDEAGKIYMLTVNYDKKTYSLESKDGKSVTFDNIDEDSITFECTGSDGLTYKEVGMRYMYAVDKDGKTVKTFTETGERDMVCSDKNGSKMLYITSKNGGPDDYISYDGGSAMLERAYFTTYMGSDGLTYTWANSTMVTLDDKFEPVKEYQFVKEYELLSDDAKDDTYTIEYKGLMSAVLIGPDDTETELTCDKGDGEEIFYKDSKGNSYKSTMDGLEKLDKAGKAVSKFDFMALCQDYTDESGEIYTLIGSEKYTLLTPSGKTVSLEETYG